MNLALWSHIDQSTDKSEVEWLSTMVQDVTVFIYKPPPTELVKGMFPNAPVPAIYTGGFNCHHTNWDHNSNPECHFLV